MRTVLILLMVGSSLAFSKTAPHFRGDLLEGGSISLKEALKPNRSLLVCFWASWCGPCIKELTVVRDKLLSDATLPLDILTINEDTPDTASDIRPTLKTNNFNFPVILDYGRGIFSKYQREQALPLSVLINHKGEIVATFQGLHEDEMLNEIRAKVGKSNSN